MTVRQVVLCSSYHSIGTLIIHRLISTFHLGNQQWQVSCADIEDGCIIRELAIDIAHKFMRGVACPVEDDGFIDDRKSLKLVVGDERPFWELTAELLSHIRVAAQEQDTFLGEDCFTHRIFPFPVLNAFLP